MFKVSEIAARDAARQAAFADEAVASQGTTATDDPVRQAQGAFDREDVLFQCAIDVMNQTAVIVAMIGSATSKRSTDPTEILNAICRQGWELVNGSFVFVAEGEQSRDKFMASGQNVAVKGRTVGYYIFRRSPENRKTQ